MEESIRLQRVKVDAGLDKELHTQHQWLATHTLKVIFQLNTCIMYYL